MRVNNRETIGQMAFVKVGALSKLPPGSVMEALVGNGTYAICNAGGEIHALDGICPHAGGPLGQGALHGTTLVCPWHAWEFDIHTGRSLHDPECDRVKAYDVAKELPADKNAKLVFYCANTMCKASEQAANRALEAGYVDVAVLPDGIMGWKSAGQKTATTPRS